MFEDGQGQEESNETVSPIEAVETEGTTSEEQQEQVSDNPAWADILTPVPQEFHGHLKEHLSKSDKYAQEVQQKFAPFKPFAEQGIDPDSINNALQLAHLIETNPRGVFDYLNQAHNFTAAQQQAIQEQNNSQGQTQKNEFDISDDESDITKDPRFQQVAQQAGFATQQIQAMQQAAINQQVERQIETEMNQLKTDFPHIPTPEVVRRAIANAQLSGKPEDLIGAAKEIDQLGFFKKPGSAPAPPNLSSGNRALPSSKVSVADMSSEERTAYVAEQLRLANEG
ncbi:hypothetical protein SEA_CASSEROLE_14 [Arthrobacter phage Casserole]|nr:hypothetical protein SEA_CASSEROLE_14 [Arthrobacter phage Casserole]